MAQCGRPPRCLSMWKSECCAQGVRERARSGVAAIAIVTFALAASAPSSHAEPSRAPFQAENSEMALPASDPVAQALKQFVDDAKWRPGVNLDWNRLRSLYSERGFEPVWTTPTDEKQVREALAHVEREGLSPGDYAIGAIL